MSFRSELGNNYGRLLLLQTRHKEVYGESASLVTIIISLINQEIARLEDD